MSTPESRLAEAGATIETIRPQRLHAVSAADLLRMHFPPRENLMSPWLPTQGLAMIYGPRGGGKTWLALALANAVASGGKLLSAFAPEPRRVAYIDGEMPGAVLQERLSAIMAGADRQPPDTDYLQFIAADLYRDGIPDLSTPEGQHEFEPLLERRDLIIIDNLSTVMRSGRENESESWIPVQEWALRQRRLGRSVAFIHHAGKAGNQRGTSKREDVLDTVISLRRPADYEPSQGARFELHFEKARGITGDDVTPLDVTLTNQDGAITWQYGTLANAEMQRVIDLKAEGLTVREIADETEISKSKVQRLLTKARMEGLVSD